MEDSEIPRMAFVLDLDELMPTFHEMKKEALEIQKGKLNDLRNRIGMLVTNFVQKIWSQTQGEYLQAVEESVHYVWFTVGDDRTCEVCGSNHGKKFKSMNSVMNEYPPHANCRCWINIEENIRPMQRFQWTPPEGW